MFWFADDALYTLWENNMRLSGLPLFPPNFPLSQSHLLLKATPPNAIVLGIRSSIHEHGGTYSFKGAEAVSMLQQKLKGESVYSGLKFNYNLSCLGSHSTKTSLRQLGASIQSRNRG